jgi:hypothetical protein
MEDNFKIRDSIKVQIVHELIEPFYLDDIKSMIRGKKCWKLSGQIFETVSKVLVAVGGIISFSSGYFNDPILSFLAGSISTLSLATLQFSSFAYTENKKQGQDLNVLLKKLNLDVIPILERRTDAVQNHSMSDKPSEIIIGDELLIPIVVQQPQQQAVKVASPRKRDLKTLKNNPAPPSADEGLIISEFIPPTATTSSILSTTTDLKEHKSSI